MDEFQQDLLASELLADVNNLDKRNAKELIEMYNEVLEQLSNKHAPVTTTTQRQWKSDVWFDAECDTKKKYFCRNERR